MKKIIEFWNRIYYAAYSIHFVISCYIIDPIMREKESRLTLSKKQRISNTTTQKAATLCIL